jgi:multimeric flavodoxin WrbA
MKKIIGLSTGRKNGNSEALLKAAAMGAVELGVETEIIRAMELRVLPCKGCFACSISSNVNVKPCMLDDDVCWILEKTMVEDAGLIVSVPCYHLRANGYFQAIAERTNHVFLMHPEVLERNNPGGIISVGNSPHWWTSLNLTTINIFVQHTRILVDQMEVGYAMELGSVLRHSKAIERAKELGRNVARALSMPKQEWKYMGEERALSCPVCHCDVIQAADELPNVACPVCWVHGVLKSDGNGKMKVEWDMEEAKHPRFSSYGVKEHYDFVVKRFTEDRAYLATDDAKRMMKEFSCYGKIIRP